jgi:hypothetical protein
VQLSLLLLLSRIIATNNRGSMLHGHFRQATMALPTRVNNAAASAKVLE